LRCAVAGLNLLRLLTSVFKNYGVVRSMWSFRFLTNFCRFMWALFIFLCTVR